MTGWKPQALRDQFSLKERRIEEMKTLRVLSVLLAALFVLSACAAPAAPITGPCAPKGDLFDCGYRFAP